MEVSVSNLQIIGAIDGLRSQIEALVAAIQTGGVGGGVGAVAAPGVEVEGGGGAAPDPAVAAPKVKRRRAKSKYNDHMSEELARLKIEYPDIGHRRRFAMAVASWKAILANNKSDAGRGGDELDEEIDDEAEGVSAK